MLAAEVAPFAKVGGLADVAAALPKTLRALGHDVYIFLPRYGRIDAARFNLARLDLEFSLDVGYESLDVGLWQGAIDDVPVFLIDIPWLFGDRASIYGDADDGRRFLLFCAAALATVERLDWKPDVIHCNDWHTAIVPAMLHDGRAGRFFSGTASVFTIHNLAYQGVVERAALGGGAALLPDDVRDAWINIMALGLMTADIVTTVSPTYSREIVTPEGGAGLDGVLRDRKDRLFGVLNGIDTDLLNPATDPTIAANFDREDPSGKLACKAVLQQEAGFVVDPAVPLLGMIGRLVNQKGLDLFAAAIEPLLNQTPLQVVILGTGDPAYHALLEHLQRAYPGRIRAWLTFDGIPAEYIYAGVDMFLLPSRFEPCGLGQMIAMRYGSVPIVRATGGLAETVEEGPPSHPRTGFVFGPYEPGALQDAVLRALDSYSRPAEWRMLMRNGMCADHSWRRSANAYIDLYRRALVLHRGLDLAR